MHSIVADQDSLLKSFSASSNSSCSGSGIKIKKMAAEWKGGETITVPPIGEHKATLIFMHGLGDSAHGWFPVWSKAPVKGLKRILPTAPVAPVSLNGGMRMSSWYDIYGLHDDVKQDAEGVKASVAAIHAMVDKEIENGLSSEKIFIGGFSQGGAIAYYAGLTYPKKLGGIIGLSTYLAIADECLKNASENNKDISLFVGHGTSDNVVSYEWGKKSVEKLKEEGYNVKFESYPNMMHSTCAQEIMDLVEWLNEKV